MDESKTLKLLALCAVDGKSPKKQFWLMSKAGYTPAEIAELLDVAPQTVSNNLSDIRKALRKGKSPY